MEKMNIVLGVTGSVAAFKAAELASTWVKGGHDVHVIMTDAAKKFVTPLTFQSLTKQRVYNDMFEELSYMDIKHISLAQRADVFVIAPATANIIGKIAAGIADDMLSTVVMATRAPVVICPAMNTAMYENPIVQANIVKLEDLGYIFVEPKEARLACGDVGRGAMADPCYIAEMVNKIMDKKDVPANAPTPTPDIALESESYSLEEVENHLKDPRVALMFKNIEDILGKLLKDTERQMYLSFNDEMGLPEDVIEFMVSYCLDRGKKGNAYIRTVAQNWAEQGIDNVDEAEEFVKLFNNEYRDILRHFGVSGRDPIPKEVQYMQRWLKEDNFSMAIIKLACEKTVMNKGAANFPYADGILNKWKQENIQTIEQIEALEKSYYDNESMKAFKRPVAKAPVKKFQNYKGRKWDYDKLAQIERDYIKKRLTED